MGTFLKIKNFNILFGQTIKKKLIEIPFSHLFQLLSFGWNRLFISHVFLLQEKKICFYAINNLQFLIYQILKTELVLKTIRFYSKTKTLSKYI
jgi:hypothetical protein